MEIVKIGKNVAITYENYEQLHRKIEVCHNMIGLSLFNYVQALKEMHDTKLYKAAGYTSFEEYTYAAFNIKKSQAYDIMALACYSKEFFKEYGNLGVAKLRVMTSLPEPEASKFIDENEIENATVSEVKKKIKSYKSLSLEEEIVIDVEPHEELDVSIPAEVDVIIYNNFGEFLKAKRIAKEISTRDMSERLLVSKSYLLNIENNRRMPKNDMFFKTLIKELNLDSYDTLWMYELRDKYYAEHKRIAPDLSEFINESKDIKELIRKIKDGNLTKSYWDEYFTKFMN